MISSAGQDKGCSTAAALLIEACITQTTIIKNNHGNEGWYNYVVVKVVRRRGHSLLFVVIAIESAADTVPAFVDCDILSKNQKPNCFVRRFPNPADIV
jgi:hypothetical protein